MFYIIGPVDLKLIASSPTMLNLTVIPPKNFGGHWFRLNFKDGEYATQCFVYYSHPSLACVYLGLEPATRYTFEYCVGAVPGGLDISSEYKYKSFFTPS